MVTEHDVIEEVRSVVPNSSITAAREVVKLAQAEPGTTKEVFRGKARRTMTQAQAKRLVDSACKRAELSLE